MTDLMTEQGAAEDAGPAESPPGGELNAAVARAVVGIYRDVAGRGPTRARAFFRDDVLVVVLRDVLTTGERSMVRAGRADSARATRDALQDVMRDALIAAVERITGRRVEVLLGSSEAESGVAAQVFLLDHPVHAVAADATAPRYANGER
ncbi:MAG TPA: Na-translocating system protein MpsC family protein [Baekduia sp.]